MSQKMPEIMPMAWQFDAMQQDQYTYGVNARNSFGIVGMYSDSMELFDDPEYVPTDKYFFYWKFTPMFDIRIVNEGWLKIAFQKGD